MLCCHLDFEKARLLQKQMREEASHCSQASSAGKSKRVVVKSIPFKKQGNINPFLFSQSGVNRQAPFFFRGAKASADQVVHAVLQWALLAERGHELQEATPSKVEDLNPRHV